MKKFTLGAVVGMSSLAVALPLLAHVSSAASSSSTSSMAKVEPTPPSQACVQALADMDTARLGNIDTRAAAEKTALEAHRSALIAAADILDATARQAAVRKANDTMHEAMKAAMPSDDQMKTQMDALKSACGESFAGPGPMGGMMRGGPKGHGMRSPEKLAEKLGITADELKAELGAGKTIEQIATEHGVTLPERPIKGMRGGFRVHGPMDPTENSDQ